MQITPSCFALIGFLILSGLPTRVKSSSIPTSTNITEDSEALWFLLDTVMTPYTTNEKNDQGCITCFAKCPEEMIAVWANGEQICIDSNTRRSSENDIDI